MTTNENTNCTCTTPEYTIILNQQGPSGRQGAAGQNGFSPIISVATDNASTYTLTITTADGTFTTPNLKSALPTDGSEGQVLTNFGNNVYGWSYIDTVTTDTVQDIYASKTFIDADLNILTDDTVGKGYGITAANNKPRIYINDASNGIPTGIIGFVLQTDNIIQGEGITITPNLVDGTVTFAATGAGGDNVTIKALTSIEYEALTPDPDTMYRLTDTNKVYLGAIDLTGGGTPTTIDGGNAASVSETAVINNISQRTDTNDYPKINTIEETISITTPEQEETT